MEKNTELLLKEFKAEVKKVLQNFDDTINSKLGDTVTITTGRETIIRKATLQDATDLYQNEWSNTVDLLDEIGINIEVDNVTSITMKVNHKAICNELQEYADRADSNGATSYLEYKNIQIPYKNIHMEDDHLGGTMLIPYMGDNIDDSTAAFVLLDKDTEYRVIDKIGEGEQPLLIEK